MGKKLSQIALSENAQPLTKFLTRWVPSQISEGKNHSQIIEFLELSYVKTVANFAGVTHNSSASELELSRKLFARKSYLDFLGDLRSFKKKSESFKDVEGLMLVLHKAYQGSHMNAIFLSQDLYAALFTVYLVKLGMSGRNLGLTAGKSTNWVNKKMKLLAIERG